MKLRTFLFIIGTITGLFGLGSFEHAPAHENPGVGLMIFSLVLFFVSVIVPSNIYLTFKNN